MSDTAASRRWVWGAAFAIIAGALAYFVLEFGKEAAAIPLESEERLARIEAMAVAGPKEPDFTPVFDPSDPSGLADLSPALAANNDDISTTEADARPYVEAVCGGCHSFTLVAQQRLTRSKWDAMITLMAKDHGMAELEAYDRESVLNFLESHYGPASGGQAPAITSAQ